jgi:DNA-binding SARP family transcriptional activator/ATP/maltotriose-dependent transcriptional regulator MalT
VLGASTCVVIGGAGYGKSALAAESADRLGVLTISTALESGRVQASLLPHRLRSAAARVGLSDIAARMEQAAAAGPAGMLDALLEAMAGQGAVIVVDEIQHAEPDAVALLTRLAAQLAPDQRLLLLGRDAPAGLGPLRRDGTAAWLGPADLAMTTEEVRTLWREGFGLPVSAGEAGRLRSATDGWTAAVVLAAIRAQLDRDDGHRRTRAGGRRTGPDRAGPAGRLAPAGASGSAGVLSNLVDEILTGLPRRAQAAVVQAAHLPVLTETIAERATGVPALLALISRAGMPVRDRGDGWSQLIGPVQDLLAARAPAQPSVLAAAAAAYAETGHPGLAAELLMGAGQPDGAAALLAAMSPQDAERMGLAELSGLVDRLPAGVVAAHPRVLLHVARECEPPAAIHRRAQALQQALELLGEPPSDPPLARELRAEVARDLTRDDDPRGAEALATAVLAQTGPGEERTQARLLDALGRAALLYKDDQNLAHAADRLAMAARSYRSLGLWSWLAYTLAALGAWVHGDRGAVEPAIAAIDEALAVIPDRRQQRAVILTFRAEVLDAVGRYEEGTANLEEAENIARAIGDVRVRAYVHWERARVLAQQGDGPGTLAAIHATESFRSDWFDGCGAEFLAEAADCLDKVGYRELALQYLARAEEQSEHEDFEVERATVGLLARGGDPEEAERRLVEFAASPWCEPAERWRVQLLRAVAAQRRGDPAATALAIDALELAARLGHPGLPLIRERDAAQRVLGLVEATGHPLAASLAAIQFPVTVLVLGGFGVSRGGRVVEVPPGQGRQLVKLVAVSGGRLAADAVMEMLWPETEPELSANRLRTVLNRLRDAAGDIVIREDRLLRLGPEVTTDVQAFGDNARRALALAAAQSREAVSAARAALARYRGDLLPEDQYEPWLEAPREQLRRQALALLDLCRASAAAAGDLDEAVRCLERAIELAPDEEERYVAAASHLLMQGRRGAARGMARKARAVVEDLGVRPPPALVELEQRTRTRAPAVS